MEFLPVSAAAVDAAGGGAAAVPPPHARLHLRAVHGGGDGRSRPQPRRKARAIRSPLHVHLHRHRDTRLHHVGSLCCVARFVARVKSVAGITAIE